MIAEELLGQTLGPYQIETILGSGGMAVVYRARHTQGDVVALKVLFPPPGAGREVLARFEREARTAARLRHPAIARVFEAGQAKGRAFMAMALIDGQTLAERLAQAGPLDEATAADIAWQMADALDYAHRQGVVHRDTKPSNIMLEANSQALLTDFGVALALDDLTLTRTGQTVGTPAYMAPEQASGDAVDGRADLYALGVVLYQMVTGRTPFRGNTPQVLHAHVYDPPPAPSRIAKVSAAMEAIILQALAKDPTQRFQTGAAMAQALARLSDQTAALPVSSPTETASPTRPRSPWFWPMIGVAGILVILVTSTIFAFTRSILTHPGETVSAFIPSPTRLVDISPTVTPSPSPLASPTQPPTPTEVPANTPTPFVTSTPTLTLTFTPSATPEVQPGLVTATPVALPASPGPPADPPALIATPPLSTTATPCALPITTTLTLLLDNTSSSEALGCPRAEAIVVTAAQQPFENGLLLWRQDVNLIYGLGPDKTWFFTGDTWRDGDPSDDPAISPPADLYQPVRGFGKVWRERFGVREALDWATAEEAGFTAIIQEFSGGSVWRDAERAALVILFNNGSYLIRGF